MLMIVPLKPMFAACLVIVHTSRSVTTALSGGTIQQHLRSSYAPALGRRFNTNFFRSNVQNTVMPSLQQNQPTAKPLLSQHQNQQSLLFSSTDGSNSNTIDDSTIMGIPTIEQLRTDSFMKQVRYAEFITGLIEEDNGRETDVLMNRLRPQLSHPDGIRGFMVTFLTTLSATTDKTDTTTGSSNEDGRVVIPPALIKAIIEQIDPISDANELISLMCMNVIMPTGMITMQPNEEMAQQSATTAQRATQLLKAVLAHCGSNSSSMSTSEENNIRSAIVAQCDAILAVATAEIASTTASDCTSSHYAANEIRQTYWRKFFEKWGYQSQQQSDIADAIRFVLS